MADFDLTGFFMRFCAIILNKRTDAVPEQELRLSEDGILNSSRLDI